NQFMGPDDYGWMTFAQPEATERLFHGIDPDLLGGLMQVIPQDLWDDKVLPMVVEAQRNPVVPGMPLADAISLADYLANVTAQYDGVLGEGGCVAPRLGAAFLAPVVRGSVEAWTPTPPGRSFSS